MKTTLLSLFVAIGLLATASAAPYIRVDIDLLERSDAGDKTLMHPVVLTTSGKEATIQSGDFEFSITPTLRDDGNLDVSAVLTKHEGKNVREIVDQRIKAKLGHVTEVQVENLVFRTNPSLTK